MNYYILFLCMSMVFVLAFASLKPAWLHDANGSFCAPRSWCNVQLDPATKTYQVNTYEFPDFVTHSYHIGNIVSGLILLGLIYFFMYVGNSSYKQIKRQRENKEL